MAAIWGTAPLGPNLLGSVEEMRRSRAGRAGIGTGDAARTDYESGASSRRGAPGELPPCATLGGRSIVTLRSIPAPDPPPEGIMTVGKPQ